MYVHILWSGVHLLHSELVALCNDQDGGGHNRRRYSILSSSEDDDSEGTPLCGAYYFQLVLSIEEGSYVFCYIVLYVV